MEMEITCNALLCGTNCNCNCKLRTVTVADYLRAIFGSAIETTSKRTYYESIDDAIECYQTYVNRNSSSTSKSKDSSSKSIFKF
jgi:hypothetical protein